MTRRVHGAVLICVKTAAILGAVLSLDSLKEEDYMRLVKMIWKPRIADDLTPANIAGRVQAKPASSFMIEAKFLPRSVRLSARGPSGITTEQALLTRLQQTI